jgi:hypothetical protein
VDSIFFQQSCLIIDKFKRSSVAREWYLTIITLLDAFREVSCESYIKITVSLTM